MRGCSGRQPQSDVAATQRDGVRAQFADKAVIAGSRGCKVIPGQLENLTGVP